MTTTSAPEIQWDGQIHAYQPRPDWRSRISRSITLDEESVADIDPVTYEVIRSRLWTINLAHGETLKRVSGSPVFQASDFNMCILSADGETVMNAAYAQYLNAGASLTVRYILENLSSDIGIEEGDVFLCNDPWIGAVHQMDVTIAMPVFVDGKIFAWVSNAGHQYDLGGIAAGGWPEAAPDVYSDPVVVPPFKLVERGTMRKDLEGVFLRNSRFPGLVALDLRSQLAGCRFAEQQLKEVCREFGPAVVKAAMLRLLSAAQESFAAKLRRIPDGVWSEVFYFDEKLPGDRNTQRIQINIEKAGDRLVVTNTGTQAQEEGPNGIAFVAFTGAFLGAATTVMLQDQLFTAGAVARQVEFDLTPGLLNCVDHPAAVSAGVNSTLTTYEACVSLLTRMMTSDPVLAEDMIVNGGELALIVASGVNDRGRAFGTALLEQAGGRGATLHADGLDHIGMLAGPLYRYQNAEEQESYYPLLILWRRQNADSGGAGRLRGGGGLLSGVTEYRSGQMFLSTNTGGMGVSGYSARSIMGAYPTPTIEYRLLRDTNLAELFKTSRIPTAADDIEAGSDQLLRGKSTGNVLKPNDVIATRHAGGGGLGDPIEREPGKVAADVAEGWVSVGAARAVYGVAVDETGAVDDALTANLRAEIRKARQDWTPVSQLAPESSGATDPATGEPDRPVSTVVEAADAGSERILRCVACKTRFSSYTGNYVDGLLVSDVPTTEVPGNHDASYYLDVPIVLRRYCCPGCQTLISCRVLLASEPHVADVRLAPTR